MRRAAPSRWSTSPWWSANRPPRARSRSAPLLKTLADEGVPHILFVNKIDTLEGGVRDTLSALQAYSKYPLVLRQVPIREGEKVSGYVDVVSERAYLYRKGQPSELIQLPSHMEEREKEALTTLLEVLADHDDALLEKILEDVTPSTQEIYDQLHKDQVSGTVVEVLLGSAENDNGVRRLWKALRHDTPGAARRPRGAVSRPRASLCAGVQDRPCRPHRQALLCAHLARPAEGRRDLGRLPARRHLPDAGRRGDQGGRGAAGRTGRARPAGGRRDRCHALTLGRRRRRCRSRCRPSRSTRWRSRPRTARTTSSYRARCRSWSRRTRARGRP